MRAVGVFPGSREVRIIEHDEPRIAAPDEVKLRMLEVGVCGTDRALCAFEFGSAPAGCDHFVLGHESLAEVVETGDAVTSVRPGDLAVAMVRHPCASAWCEACRSGRQDFCATGGYRERGIKELHGFMTEYVTEQARFVYAIPPALRVIGVLIEPLTIAEKAYLQFLAIEKRLPWSRQKRTAVVLGAGPVGLLGAMLFHNAGFDTRVYSREAHSPVVEAIGARYVCSLEVSPEQLAGMCGGIDVVYEAMGAPQTAFDVLQHLGANGVFVFTGVPAPDEKLQPDLHRLMMSMIVRNLVVAGTVNAGSNAFDAAIRDLARFQQRWPQALDGMITGRYPIEGFRDAIFEPGGIKRVIEL